MQNYNKKSATLQTWKLFFALWILVERFEALENAFVKIYFAMLDFVITFVKNQVFNIPGIFVGE